MQSESHPVEFRKVELLNLVGCKDPKAKNYKAYFVKETGGACRVLGSSLRAAGLGRCRLSSRTNPRAWSLEPRSLTSPFNRQRAV